MSVKDATQGRHQGRMSNLSFKLMTAAFAIVDLLFPRVEKRVATFGIRPGMTLVDYGCGPGRYTLRFSNLVGERGKVYAVDVHELAIEAIRQMMLKHDLGNVEPRLAEGYNSALPSNAADMVFALDMFFSVRRPNLFLAELKRITKPDGLLIIDGGHQSRAQTRKKILDSGHWIIREERRDHLRCAPR
jgi:ubiquinone/menaquinone biosynthesis C-methylase UbiE